MAGQKKQSYLTGAVILAVTAALTKGIGAIYKIPLFNLLGDEGTAHFQVTYNIYTLLLTISTAGVPLALSRLISSSRALGKFGQAKNYYTVGMLVFGTIGLVGTAFMLWQAPWLAEIMHDPEVTLGIRLLSPAVLFSCIVSVYRGYAQGHQNMIPTAISQFVEVICKLIFGLSIAWYLSKEGYGLATVAAGAIVGVTIGMGLSVPIMAVCKGRIAARSREQITDTPTGSKQTILQILKVSIPITVGAATMSLINIIDTENVLGRLVDGAGFSDTEAQVLYGVYSKGISLFHIPSSLITPVVMAVVPAIAAALAKHFRAEARGTMESCIRITNLLALPCAMGLCVLAKPIFNLLFPNSNENGPALLALLGIASYFVCCYSITNGILQASGHELLALVSLPVGGIVKIAVNYTLVGRADVHILGAPIGTICCYFVITLLNMFFMVVTLPVKIRFTKLTIRPLICTSVMGLTAWAVYGLLERFVLPILGNSRLGLILCLGAAIVVAAIVYLTLAVTIQAVKKEDVLLLPRGKRLVKTFKIR